MIEIYLFIDFFNFQRLKEGRYAKIDTYVAHIRCSANPFSCLMATSKYFYVKLTFDSVFLFLRRIFFIQENSAFDEYEIDWIIEYSELLQVPSIRNDSFSIEILVNGKHSKGKTVKYLDVNDARVSIFFRKSFLNILSLDIFLIFQYLIDKIRSAMYSLGLK